MSAPGVRRAGMTLFVTVSLLVAAFVAPGGYESPFSGAPLTDLGRRVLLGLLVLAGLAFIFRLRRPLPTWLPVLLVGLILGKCIVARVDAPVGWKGVYQITDSLPAATGTFFWRFGAHDFRIDREIKFEAAGTGLHFLNDYVRYGGLPSPGGRDVDLPIRMTWNGVVTIPDTRPLTFFINARGTISIALDGRIVHAGPADHVTAATADISPGQHGVTVVYDKPPGTGPLVEVRVTSRDGVPLEVQPWAQASGAPGRRRALGAVTTALVIGAIVVVLLTAIRSSLSGVRPRQGGVAPALAAIVVAAGLLFGGWQSWRVYHGATIHLSAGSDSLFYESAARDVMLNGLAMPTGRPIGQGEPYYFYPFYSYALAGAHWVIGDDFTAVMVFNAILIASVPLLLWSLGWNTLSGLRACTALGVLAVFATWHLVPYEMWAYTDNLFIVLALAALTVVKRALETGRASLSAGAGLLSALAAATRPSFMTFVPLLVAAVMLGVTPLPRPRRLAVAAVLVAGFALGLAPFAIRNYVVSRRPVLLVSSWIQLPYFLIPPERPNPVYSKHGTPPTLVESVAWAVRIIREDPVQAAVVEGRKLLFTLGATHVGMAGTTAHPEFLAITVLGLAALWRRHGPPALRATLLVFAGSHIIAMLMAAPWTYGYKSILPLQVAWLAAAAYLFQREGAPKDDQPAAAAAAA